MITKQEIVKNAIARRLTTILTSAVPKKDHLKPDIR